MAKDPTLAGIPHFMDSLRRLKKLKGDLTAFLSNLTSHLEEVVGIYRPQILGHGLDSLPDTVLMFIFELGRNTEDKYEGWLESVRLSHVNKRFRRVALSTPRLWSTFTITQPAAAREVLLQRSRAVDLMVFINSSFLVTKLKIQPFTNFLEFVIPLAPRCMRFEYAQVGEIDEVDESEKADLLRLMDKIYFPRLTHLSVEYWGPDRRVRATRKPDFYRNWRMPSLQQFVAFNAVPAAATPLNIVSCNITIHSEDDEPVDLLILTQSIRADHLPSLQIFSLSLRNVLSQDSEVTLPQLTLPSSTLR